jgi:hypothetical protein
MESSFGFTPEPSSTPVLPTFPEPAPTDTQPDDGPTIAERITANLGLQPGLLDDDLSDNELATPHPPTPSTTATATATEEAKEQEQEAEVPTQVPTQLSPFGPGQCETLYSEKGNNKLILFAMCCGIQDKDGQRIAELEEEPYSSLLPNVNKMKKFKVGREDLIEEVGHHCEERELRINKCSNWKKDKIKQELYKTLPLKDIDIAWLIAEEARFLQALTAAVGKATPAAAAGRRRCRHG